MERDPGFGVLLTRLAKRRNLDVDALAHATGSDVRAVFDGAPPDPGLLRRLAPVLRLHTADLFAVAAMPVPEDLAPLDPDAERWVYDVVREAVALPPRKRQELRELVAALPQQERSKPARLPSAHGTYVTLPGPGAILMRMIANRNLGWSRTAAVFLILTGRYWSATTYGRVGRGGKALTPDLLADYSALIDVPDEDLAALTGLTPVAGSRPVDVTGVAELIWALRRLTAEQVEHVHAVAKAMASAGPATSAE